MVSLNLSGSKLQAVTYTFNSRGRWRHNRLWHQDWKQKRAPKDDLGFVCENETENWNISVVNSSHSLVFRDKRWCDNDSLFFLENLTLSQAIYRHKTPFFFLAWAERLRKRDSALKIKHLFQEQVRWEAGLKRHDEEDEKREKQRYKPWGKRYSNLLERERTRNWLIEKKRCQAGFFYWTAH